MYFHFEGNSIDLNRLNDETCLPARQESLPKSKRELSIQGNRPEEATRTKTGARLHRVPDKQNLNVFLKFLLVSLFMTSIFTLSAFTPQTVSFTININNFPTNLKTFSVFVMPGETITIEASGSSADQFVLQYAQGQLTEKSRNKWDYTVPKTSGHYELIILHNNPPEKMKLNVFVMVPATEQNGEYLNGYRIGYYPEKPFRDLPEYKRPIGFIEVTEANKDVFVSPHFQLKQFLCKQQPNHWPKYLLLRPHILQKLELLLQKLNSKDIEAEEVFIMSGYRTPYYNKSIGNGKYSRHLYGDALDIYVDDNHDGVIDDLNKDGTASMKDADVIYNIVKEMDNNPKYGHLIGGLGKYKKTSTHTWDVHVDTRGYRARW